MPKLLRETHLAPKIVYVDGLWGSGKSLLGPIVGSFEGIEKQKVIEILEHLSILKMLHRVDDDVCVNLMRIHTDIQAFNMYISREVNLRMNDDTGFLNNPKKIMYLKRLFDKDGDAALQRFYKEKPVLNVMIHQILWAVKPSFDAFGDRLSVVEVVRHPLYMVDHWMNYLDRCGTDPAEFDIWLDHQGTSIPWFTEGWEDLFLSSPTMDRVIYSLDWLLSRTYQAVDALTKEQKQRVMFVPFEKFVVEPWPYVEKLEEFLDTKSTPQTPWALKKQRCPRECLTAGLGHKGYGWEKPSKDTTDKKQYAQKLAFVKENAGPEAFKVMEKLVQAYEGMYDVHI
ncbi:MAG: hypothetical protein KC713_05485 [Candidatus Omnitrophica bacterium]|nr:hypothetical protein [Candidatus Omnitrophota bacterium]